MYSYLLFGYVGGNSIEQGTCFFVRRNGRLFLVTALHIFEGWDGVRGILDEPYTNEFFLRLPIRDTGVWEFIAINTTAYREAVTQHRFYERADLCVLEMTLPDRYNIRSIEDILFNELTITEEIRQLTAAGFPVDDTLNDRVTYIDLLPLQEVTLEPIGNITLPVHWPPPIDRIDPYHYQIRVVAGQFAPGHSGSPVLFTQTDSVRNERTAFGGIWVIGNPRDYTGMILRPEFIRQEILRLAP